MLKTIRLIIELGSAVYRAFADPFPANIVTNDEFISTIAISPLVFIIDQPF